MKKLLEKLGAFRNPFIDFQFNYLPLTWMFLKEIIYFKFQKIYHKS